MNKNYYQVLGISRDASLIETKIAYRKLAQKFHPDKNDGDKYFADRFREVQEAYEILSNPLKKENYNREYDSFLNERQKTYSTNARKKESKRNPEQESKHKEKQEKAAKERAEKERVISIKKKAELPFEDKAWIFLGNWFLIGVLGIIMFIKYRVDGYTKKSNQVCSVTLISLGVLIVLTIILTLAKKANG